MYEEGEVRAVQLSKHSKYNCFQNVYYKKTDIIDDKYIYMLYIT